MSDEALRLFMRAAYPVATEINPRGYNWSEAYLDQALAAAQSAAPAAPMTADIAALVERLRPWLQHQAACRMQMRMGAKSCSCGLNDALTALRAGTGGEREKLPRLTEKMIRAACMAHYGDDTIDGIDLTADSINYTFRQGFQRMWNGIRKSLSPSSGSVSG